MTKDEALKLALEALKHMCHHTKAKVGYKGKIVEAAMSAAEEALAQPEQESVAAAKKDEVFAASIEFIGTLTGMTPPPIEIAPPEVFKPFRDFTEKVCLILNTTPPQRKPLTDEECVRLAKTVAVNKHQIRAIEAAHGIKEKNT